MGRDWTADEDDFLKANYGKLSASECARQLPYRNRNRSMVIGRASRLGLTSQIIGGGWAGGKLRQRGDPKTKVRKPYVSNGRKSVEYEEPAMPLLEGDQKLHSRQWADLEDGMCKWPLYYEQNVQMYCAARTARAPGRWAIYCDCHAEASTRREAPHAYVRPGRYTT